MTYQWNMKKHHRKTRREFDNMYTSYASATKATDSLQSSIMALAAMIRQDAGGPIDNFVHALLKQSQRDLDAQNAANNTLLKRVPPEYRKPARASALAAQVFGMPEMLEHILTFTDTADILRAYAVSKTWYNTIEGSIKLQRALGLAADAESDFFSPIRYLTFFSNIRVRDSSKKDNVYSNLDDTGFKTSLTFDERFDHHNFKLGQRCAKMLITQPPMNEMHAFVLCRCRTRLSRFARSAASPTAKITSTTRITMGQILEAVSQLRAAHALCPEASADDHDEQGFVRSRITLEGVLALKEDDPVLQKKPSGGSSQEGREEMLARLSAIQQYIAAKRSACDNGHPIPTLAEFKIAQGMGRS